MIICPPSHGVQFDAVASDSLDRDELKLLVKKNVPGQNIAVAVAN